ncbi:NUDIX hydrolase [Rossellomorea marisflavi]|uniref:NUDIX hydrolase n=1 Tax=Rossellomorea marisflavi TaxID=189381 RepID=UPI003457EE74
MSDYIKEMRGLIGTQPLMVAGATVLCINERKELLLQYRADADIWGLPGGVMEYGESLEETAARELHEETGLLAGELQFIRVLSGPEECHTYPNGDQIYGITAVYLARTTTGTLKITRESRELRYFPLDDLPSPLVSKARRIVNELSPEWM